LELLRQQLLVPLGELTQAVVSDPKGSNLSGAQVIEADRRHLSNAKRAAGGQAAVPADDVELGIDQDWDIKAECLDVIGEFENLFFAVLTRVSRIRLQLTDPSVDDLERSRATFTSTHKIIHDQYPLK